MSAVLRVLAIVAGGVGLTLFLLALTVDAFVRGYWLLGVLDLVMLCVWIGLAMDIALLLIDRYAPIERGQGDGNG